MRRASRRSGCSRRFRADRLLGLAVGGHARRPAQRLRRKRPQPGVDGLLYSLSAAGEERQHGVRLVYGAVAAVVGMQLIAQMLGLFQPSEVVAEPT